MLSADPHVELRKLVAQLADEQGGKSKRTLSALSRRISERCRRDQLCFAVDGLAIERQFSGSLQDILASAPWDLIDGNVLECILNIPFNRDVCAQLGLLMLVNGPEGLVASLDINRHIGPLYQTAIFADPFEFAPLVEAPIFDSKVELVGEVLVWLAYQVAVHKQAVMTEALLAMARGLASLRSPSARHALQTLLVAATHVNEANVVRVAEALVDVPVEGDLIDLLILLTGFSTGAAVLGAPLCRQITVDKYDELTAHDADKVLALLVNVVDRDVPNRCLLEELANQKRACWLLTEKGCLLLGFVHEFNHRRLLAATETSRVLSTVRAFLDGHEDELDEESRVLIDRMLRHLSA